jgi:uncharacterized protein (TIGR03437 family)
MTRTAVLSGIDRTASVIWASFLGAILAAGATSPPQIAPNGVLNSASSAMVGAANSSIAEGSIFSIYGSHLGPSSSPATAYPLQTTLGGVSVQVMGVNGATLNAIPIFVSPNVVNAILPDNTPVGAAGVYITYNGQASAAVPFQVVANSFGIFSVNSNGWGAGVITGTNYQLYSASAPATPGETAVIWGTGLGASPGDTGTAPPQQIDMPNLPLSVYVGTQAATVSYRGRAAFTGEDQINFVIPSGITGCYVPVAVEIGNIVSNFVTMPIAPAGQSCPDPTPAPVPPLGLGPPGIPPPTGDIILVSETNITTATVTTELAVAFFGTPQTNEFPYVPPLYSNPFALPPGTCVGNTGFPPFIDVLAEPLPAGTMTLSGPNGTVQVPPLGPNSGSYSTQIGGGSGASAEPLFLSAGSYTVSGVGGAFVAPALPGPGVGPFSQNITVPTPLTWTNQADITVIDRSAPLEITWAGGDPNGTVQITGDLGFICNANAGDGHFTIPAFVLTTYVPGAGYLEIGASSTTPFTASGISSGAIHSAVFFRKNVTYQ